MSTAKKKERNIRESAEHAEGLTAEQVAFYDENGFLGPLTLCSPEEMAEIRNWIDAEGFLDRPSPIYGSGPRDTKVLRDWHLVYRRMYDLCTHPKIAATMASIMGPDLLLWRSQFQLKEAGGQAVAWHQDLGFPGHLMMPALDPVKNISAWIAVDEANLENGCVWLVPGTHKRRIQRRMTKPDESERGLFGRQYKVEYVVDTSTAVAMPVVPGQYFLFSESSLHGSPPNPTKRRRMGISLRVTTPEVKVYAGQTIDGQGYALDKWGCVLMCGKDRFGYNRMANPIFLDD